MPLDLAPILERHTALRFAGRLDLDLGAFVETYIATGLGASDLDALATLCAGQLRGALSPTLGPDAFAIDTVVLRGEHLALAKHLEGSAAVVLFADGSMPLGFAMATLNELAIALRSHP